MISNLYAKLDIASSCRTLAHCSFVVASSHGCRLRGITGNIQIASLFRGLRRAERGDRAALLAVRHKQSLQTERAVAYGIWRSHRPETHRAQKTKTLGETSIARRHLQGPLSSRAPASCARTELRHQHRDSCFANGRAQVECRSPQRAGTRSTTHWEIERSRSGKENRGSIFRREVSTEIEPDGTGAEPAG